MDYKERRTIIRETWGNKDTMLETKNYFKTNNADKTNKASWHMKVFFLVGFSKSSELNAELMRENQNFQVSWLISTISWSCFLSLPMKRKTVMQKLLLIKNNSCRRTNQKKRTNGSYLIKSVTRLASISRVLDVNTRWISTTIPVWNASVLIGVQHFGRLG